MKEEIAEQERAAPAVLKSTGIDVPEAKEAPAAGRGRVKKAQRCLQLGQGQLRLQGKVVTFRNLQELQWEMGHRDSTLLRTRYISPVSREAAARFRQLPSEEQAQAFFSPREG